jgi:hypothetical protein
MTSIFSKRLNVALGESSPRVAWDKFGNLTQNRSGQKSSNYAGRNSIGAFSQLEHNTASKSI